MRTIPPELQARLDTGVTTLCRCWTITRRDGVSQGFTDHDRDIDLDGVACRAGAGLSSSEQTQRLGLAATGAELAGALSADSLNEDDLAAGLYDAAAVAVYLVDWSAPHLRVRLASGVLGEVRRAGTAFSAELRGLAHRMQEDSGRRFTPTCDADLGDARCGVDLTAAALRGAGSVSVVSSRSSIVVAGLGGFADGWFTAGRLSWTNGANAGLAVEVKRHRAATGAATLDLWQAPAHAPVVGDTFAITAGCDKRFATCRDRFDNAANFRGFPHIPGNDFLVRVAFAGEPGHDGAAFGGG